MKLMGKSARNNCRWLQNDAAFVSRNVLIVIAVGLLLFGGSRIAEAQDLTHFGNVQTFQSPVSGSTSWSSQTSQSSSTSPDQWLTGTIDGMVVDQTGTGVNGARVTLTRDGQPSQDVQTDDDGGFSFRNVAAGPFHVSIAAEGFTTQTESGTLNPGQTYVLPRITLALASLVTSVTVMPQAEIAEKQIKQEEQQRVIGVVPNFYVTYLSDPAPLNARQKFELAWKNSIDPFTFGIVGAVAGIQQEENNFGGYGQGAAGYARRYGASYGDSVIGTFIGSAILPSLFHQDPRYFYKGTGGTRARILYALVNSVICKGDNKHWQPNYSNILGSLAAGGVSNLYYPPQSRNGVDLTFESAAIGIAATAGANLLQEFVVRRFTPKMSNRDPAQP